MNKEGLRSDGIPFEYAISIAFGIPPVRIIGPDWIAEERYAMTAIVAPNTKQSFPALLREELTRRLQLVVRKDEKDFDVFLLKTVKGLPPKFRASAKGAERTVHVSDGKMTARAAGPSNLAGVLQNLLARPVIDETGLTASYEFEFSWPERSAGPISAALNTQLALSMVPAKRRMEVLVIDKAEKSTSLALLARISHLSSRLPPGMRSRVSTLLTVH